MAINERQAGLLVLVLIVLILGCSEQEQAMVCFEENCFKSMIASNPTDREKGLMFYGSLGKNEGMLFIYPSEDYHSVWMKDTLSSLDVIWMDSDSKIVYIAEELEPCETHCPIITPTVESRYFLEVNGGTVQELGLQVGDYAVIEFLSN